MLRRYNAKLKREMVVIQPGEYYVTKEDEIIATVLGSCISVCLKDKNSNVGGMNHFMLPGDFTNEEVFLNPNARYGMYAMELIIGDILKMGGDRGSMTAKVFGGGHVLASVPYSSNSVPKANMDFIKAFLAMEGIPVVSSDVGGIHGRKVLFMPRSNRAFVRSLVPDLDRKLADQEARYKRHIKREVEQEDVTVF